MKRSGRKPYSFLPSPLLDSSAFLPLLSFGIFNVDTDKHRYFHSPKRIDPTTTYVFPRTLGGGVILGGSRQDNDWSNEWDPELEAQILERACKLAPELGKPEDLQILGRNIGLRRKHSIQKARE